MLFFVVNDGTRIPSLFLRIDVFLLEVVGSVDFLNDFFVFGLDFLYFLFKFLELLVQVGNLFCPLVHLLGVLVFEVGEIGCGRDRRPVVAMGHSKYILK